MEKAVMAEMISYFGADVRRINHALKVHAFASLLGAQEGLSSGELYTLSLAALLHDIGIREAERKYHSSAGKYQEIEGPPVAREILLKCGVPEREHARILHLIGNHHSYAKIDGKDFQLLVEADFLVNIYEDQMEPAATKSAVAKYFKTDSGRRLAFSMYPCAGG